MLPTNPLHYYRIPMDKQKPHVYLTDEQFEKLKAHKFKNKSAQEVADVFIVYCRTGLHYKDLRHINEEYKKSKVEGLDGKDWIFWERVKTNVKAKVPFFKEVNDVIEKYGGWENLPIKSNQKMNAYLKEVADLCGITKNLTMHMARHTFATTVTLTNGVPIESVSKMLGHKNLRTTQHYAKVLDKKVSEDMKILRDKFSLTPVQQEQKIM